MDGICEWTEEVVAAVDLLGLYNKVKNGAKGSLVDAAEAHGYIAQVVEETFELWLILRDHSKLGLRHMRGRSACVCGYRRKGTVTIWRE